MGSAFGKSTYTPLTPKPVAPRTPGDYDYLFKILPIGDPGIGKTALIKRFVQQEFSGVYFVLRT